jgi:hypothetical protein
MELIVSRIDLDYWSHRYELLTGAVIRHIIQFLSCRRLVWPEKQLFRERVPKRVKCLQLQD